MGLEQLPPLRFQSDDIDVAHDALERVCCPALLRTKYIKIRQAKCPLQLVGVAVHVARVPRFQSLREAALSLEFLVRPKEKYKKDKNLVPPERRKKIVLDELASLAVKEA